MIYRISDTVDNIAARTARTQKIENVSAADVKKESNEQIKTPSYDTFEKSHTYDSQKASALKDTLTAQQTMLKDKLMSMISEQTGIYNLSINNTKFQVSDEEIEWAKKAIAEGGEFSVDAVATNIMDMAKALSGNDGAYISMLKKAVDMGFDSAAAVFGGKMPDITDETYKEIMKRFDEWEKELTETAEEINEAVEE